MKTGSPKNDELLLNPGPRPRPRPRLTFSCFLKTVLSMIGIFIIYVVFQAARMFLSSNREPHAALYQNLTAPYSPNEVVQPLLLPNHTFSIVATVWIREDAADPSASTNVDSPDVRGGGPRLLERAIFSEIVFSNLRLADKKKDVRTVASLRIPTAIFKTPDLWSYDLRASFVLIPDSPSSLDYAVNYTSWIPQSANHPPVRFWKKDDEPSLRDRIVDSYGTFIPLLTFRPINSTCSKDHSANNTSVPSEDANADDDDDMDDFESDITVTTPTNNTESDAVKSYASTLNKQVSQAHPFIITLTHLRIANISNILNRKAYERTHRNLQTTSCGQTDLKGNSDWRLCSRNYVSNANFETRVRLKKQDPVSQGTTTKWAYAPYLSLSKIATWGPLDALKVPVDREACEEISVNSTLDYNAPEIEYINVDWNIALSIWSPSKFIWTEFQEKKPLSLVGSNNGAPTEAELRKFQEHVELTSAIFGYNFNDGTHPRLKFALGLTLALTNPIYNVIGFYYWYTRASTAGISTRGTACLIFALIANNVLSIMSTASKQTVAWMSSFLWSIPAILSIFFMIKAVIRMDVEWSVGWLPTITIVGATHVERASERVDARVTWKTILPLYVTLCALFALSTYISPPSTTPQGRLDTLSPWIRNLAILPMFFIGLSLQLALNARLKTFGGAYRFVQFLRLFNTIVPQVNAYLVIAVPLTPWMERFKPSAVIELGFSAASVMQAVIYSSAAGQEEEDESKR